MIMCNLSHDLQVHKLITSLLSHTAINIMHKSVFEQHSGNILGLWIFIVEVVKLGNINILFHAEKVLRKQEYLK